MQKKLAYICSLALLAGGLKLIHSTFKEKPAAESVTMEQESSAQSNALQSKKTKQAKREPAQEKNEIAKKKNLNQKIQRATQKLQELKNCYASGTCDFPRNDPKEEFFAIGQALKKELHQFTTDVNKNNLKSPQIAEIARQFLGNEDGHVKEAALHLLSTQEISEKSLDSLLKDIIHFHDAKLIQHSMLELQRYLGGPNEEMIHQELAKAIRHGSPMVSHEITRHIQPFINEASLHHYSQTMDSLSQSSLSYKRLKTLIEEFQKLTNAA